MKYLGQDGACLIGSALVDRSDLPRGQDVFLHAFSGFRCLSSGRDGAVRTGSVDLLNRSNGGQVFGTSRTFGTCGSLDWPTGQDAV